MSEKVNGSPLFSFVEVHCLHTSADITGEYNTQCDIEFIFKMQPTFDVFGHKYEIISVKMQNAYWSDEFELLYKVHETDGDNGSVLKGIEVDQDIQKEIYRIICQEEEKENSGWLENHQFSDCEMFNGLDIDSTAIPSA